MAKSKSKPTTTVEVPVNLPADITVSRTETSVLLAVKVGGVTIPIEVPPAEAERLSGALIGHAEALLPPHAKK